jgi:hypothetical protein
MSTFLLVLALFLGWSLIGLALLALVRADASQLRITLTAPVLGTCVTALVVFPFSEAGLAIEHCAVPIAIGLLAASVLILALRRPHVHPGALAVALVCVGGLLLVSPPMFTFGFDWLANGNDDMANYVLSAQDLLRHGLLAPVDVRGLLAGRDYATVLTELHIAGARPGSDLLLAFVSRVAGLAPSEAFMPVIVAFSLCGASAVGALALQFARRWWAAVVAAGLLLVSPMATYGVLQQLFAQVWGLGIVAALFALLMRPELHEGDGPRAPDVVAIAVLAGGLFLGYVELVPEMGLAYLIYLGVLGACGRLSRRAVTRLWLPSIAIVVVVLNAYFFTELSFLKTQATHGLSTSGYPPLFGYVMVPSALPGVFGLQTLPPGVDAPHLNLTIALAMVVIGATIIASVLGTIRGSAAAVVLLVEGALGVVLIVDNSDFGIFKLTMYVQPCLIALVAAALTMITRRVVAAVCAVGAGLIFVAQLSTQRAYVNASRNPGDVRNLSAGGLIPKFRTVAAHASSVVSVTTNPVLLKLEAASAEGTPLYFQSRDAFSNLLKGYNKEARGTSHGRAERALVSGPWISRSFNLLNPGGTQDRFEEDRPANASLGSGTCTLVVPGPEEEPLNRYSLPGSSPYLAAMPCGAAHDLLAFISSNLGESFYLPFTRRNVSYYQLQQDPLYPSQTLVGFGRYALFQVLGWTPGARLALSLTTTLTHDGINQLPPASVVGATRYPFALVGRGSARVISPPLIPQMIAGVPYLLLDMGVDGRFPSVKHSGLQGLYGRSVPTDPRYLSAYVRDISLLSPEQYARLDPPAALSSFPASLNDGNLEYSGIYEDGWLDGDSYVRLAGGPTENLIVQGQVPVGAAKHLEALVNGHMVASIAVGPGPLNLRVPVPASAKDRRVELHFAATIQLAAPDLRPAAIHLGFLGFAAPRTDSRP